MNTTQVDELERLAAQAWPAPVSHALGGWQVRFGHGVTRRANSVLARLSAPDDVNDGIDAVERMYRSWGLPARFQLAPGSQPHDLDARLADRGYVRDAESLVMTAPISPAGTGDVAQVAIQPAADDAWAARWWAIDRGAEMPEALMDILAGARGRLAHAVVRDGGQIVAVGRGNVEAGWLGIFAMATDAAHRRRGLGAAVLARLIDWGVEHGAARAYLQVEAGNLGAQALYRSAGFTEAYRYHYRTRPDHR